MIDKMFNVLIIALNLTFIACSDENPSEVLFQSTVSEVSSSSIFLSEPISSSTVTVYTSSINLIESSSSIEISSSNIEIESSNSKEIIHGELTDERDGHVYKTVKIGNQWWMAENLNYAYTKPIKNELVDMDSSSICYNNEPDSCAKYGRLYMWEAAMDYSNDESCSDYDELLTTRGVCPEKWHIPSIEEWFTLLNIVNDLAAILKSTSGWLDDGNGSDTFGFNMLPAGTGNSNIGKRACYWTPAQYTRQLDEFAPISYCERAQCFCFYSNNEIITYEDNMKKYAYSVRCVKDAETSK